MGSDMSAADIHIIDDSPENKELMLNQFRENDKDNDGKLEKIQFLKVITLTIPQFLNFSDIIFAVFSNDGKYLTRTNFIEFCDSIHFLVENKEDPKSLIMRVFSYMDKNHNEYLGAAEIYSLMKIMYLSKPNAPKFKKSDAEKLIKSQKPDNAGKGLSRLEFIRLFLFYHPIGSNIVKKRLSDIERKNRFMTEQLAARRMQNSSDTKNTKQIVIPYESHTPKDMIKLNRSQWKEEFSFADEKKKGVLNQKGVAILLQNQSLIPSCFAYLITELYGEAHYINFEGYCDLMVSLGAFKNNKNCFAQKVFNRYRSRDKEYLTINQCIQFGRDICLDEISNSRRSWNARLKECKTMYCCDQINFDYFYQIMFSLQ